MSRATAWKGYKRQLAAVRELVDPDEVREHVDLQLHRLDRALAVAVDIADDRDQPVDARLRAIDRVVRVEERRARLLGLDAPQRAELGIRPLPAVQQLTPEQEREELIAFAMPAAIAVAAGPDAVQAPADAR